MNLKAPLFYILTSLFFILSFSGIGQEIDSLEKVLRTNLADTARIRVINTLVIKCFISDPTKAHALSAEALELAEKTGNGKLLAPTYLNRCRTFYGTGDPQSALEYGFKALTEYEKLNDKKGIASAANNIGAMYYVQRNYTNAMEFYQRALKQREELNDRASVAVLMSNIGTVYLDQYQNDEALKYFYSALEILKKDSSSLYNFSSVYGPMANAYWYKKNYSKSLQFHFKTLEINKKLNDNRGIANTLTNIGGVYAEMNLTDSAISYLTKAILLAKENGNLNALATAYSFMRVALAKKGNFKDALGYEIAYSHLKDSLFNSETSSKMADVYSKYEAEKTARERDIVEKAKEAEQTAKLEKQQFLTAGIGIVAVLILIFLVFIYRGYKEKQRANVIINQQKELVELKQKEIVDSINYAKRIQTALMTSDKYIQKNIERLSKK